MGLYTQEFSMRQMPIKILVCFVTVNDVYCFMSFGIIKHLSVLDSFIMPFLTFAFG